LTVRRIVTSVAIALAGAVALPVSACGSTEDLTGHQCPCTPGYRCCPKGESPEVGTCVSLGVACEPPDAATDTAHDVACQDDAHVQSPGCGG
jgi:hypothetical protein